MTARLVVGGLAPDTRHWYRFVLDGHTAQIVVPDRRLRRLVDGAPRHGFGLREPPQIGVEYRQTVIGFDPLRNQTDHGFQMLDGLFWPADARQGGAQEQQRRNMMRIDRQGALCVIDRLVKLALAHEQVGQPHM